VTDIEVSIDVAAPAEVTWATVTDWESQGEWMPMTAVTVTHPEPAGVGTRMLARSGVGHAAFDDPMQVEVWQPPHRAEVRHLGRVVTGRGVFIVEPLGPARSRFTWREELDSQGLRRYVDAAGALGSKLLLGVAVRRLARVIERRAADPSR
jgi:carbon monoxide dehydrogenase subunit G